MRESKLLYVLIFCILPFSGFSQCSNFQIVADKASACAPEIIRFTITNPIAGFNYEWDVGKGLVNGSDTLYSFYTSSKVINAKVKITLPGGGICNVLANGIAEINPKPIPIFEASNLLLCEGPDTVTVRDITPNSASRSWVVDGTNYSNTGKTITHKYVTDGSKSLSLIVTDSNGCNGVKEYEDTIVVYPNPNFSFLADVTNGCLPQAINYTLDNNPIIPDFTKSYSWSFEGIDSSIGFSVNPGVRTYNSAGEFDVTLSVEVSNGCTYAIKKEKYISIGDTVVLSLSPAITGKCEGSIIDLVQNTSPLPGKLDWTFSGVPVDVLLKSNDGAKIVGKNTGDINVQLTHAYNGCVTTKNVNSYIYVQGVKSDFSSTDNYHCEVPHTVHLDNQTDSLDATAVTYNWRVYDGTSVVYTSNVANTNFTFNSMPTSYNVELIASGNNGCKDTIKKDNFIYQNTMKVNFDVNPKIICINLQMNTTNSTPPATYVSGDLFKWYFFDKNGVDILDSSELREPTHSYQDLGFYDIKLIGYNSVGCSDTLLIEDIVEVVDAELNYSILNPIVCKGEAINVEGFTKPIHANFNHNWRFERLNSTAYYTGTDASAAITPYVPGEYRAIYTHDLSGGCIAKDTSTVFVNGVAASVKLDTSFGCAPLSVNPTAEILQDFHEGIDTSFYTYKWTVSPNTGIIINDETTSTPQFIFNSNGDYIITLEIINSAGCKYVVKSEKILTGVRSSFVATDNTICLGDSIDIIDRSYNGGSSVEWDINPAVSYTMINKGGKNFKVAIADSGDYEMRQIVTNNNICHDTSYHSFKIIEVVANFLASDSFLKCPPVFAEFQSFSKNADTLIWDFGEGELFKTESSSAGNIYTKNTGWTKGYNIRLIAENKEGCVDSLTREDYLVVAGPRPSFEMENQIGCEPLRVKFTDKSLDESYSYINYNDGSALDSSKVGDVFGVHSYIINSFTALRQTVMPSIIVYDSRGCAAVFEPEDSIEIYRSPITKTSFNNGTSICSYSDFLFEDSGKFTDARKWIYDGSEISTKNKGVIDNLSFGNHLIELISFNSNNCQDTFSQAIEIYSLPEINFSFKDSSCLLNSEKYSGVIECDTLIKLFEWNFGEPGSSGNINSTDLNAWFKYNFIGSKTVQLMAESATGCRDSVSKTITLTDATSIDNPQINYISFIDNQTIELNFEKSAIDKFGQYQISDGSKIYDIQDQDETKVTIDLVKKPTNPSYYELRVEDYCQLVGEPSVAHCFIVLSISSTSSYENELHWTPYNGWSSVLQYNVYRMDMNGVFTKLATLDGATTKYVDDGLCDKIYEYYVEAVHPSEQYTSKSFKVSQRPIYIRNSNLSSIENVTVRGDNEIHIKWDKSDFDQFKNYQLLKYENSFEKLLEEIDLEDNFYFDNDVSTDVNSYIYQVVERDRCGYMNDPDKEGKSIVLTGMYKEGSVLNWTEYRNWESGVKKYNIEIDKNGQYEVTYEGHNTLQSYEDKKVYREISGKYCYRVHAISNDKDTSYSNTVCVFGNPKVLVPTAFTPNGDGINESFNPVCRFILSGELEEVNSFSLKIFNRWGEKVYESDDATRGWDGSYKNADCPEGVYLYQTTITGLEYNKIYLNGSITLLR